jgi:hypothetical protein
MSDTAISRAEWGEDVGSDRVVSLRLVVKPDPDADPEAGDQLARRLCAEIAELDVESVSLAADGIAPDGAKGADAVTLGALAVALSASGGVFTGLIQTLRDWLGRQSARHRISVTIDGDTIELERASTGQQQALVDAYVERHTGGRAG